MYVCTYVHTHVCTYVYVCIIYVRMYAGMYVRTKKCVNLLCCSLKLWANHYIITHYPTILKALGVLTVMTTNFTVLGDVICSLVKYAASMNRNVIMEAEVTLKCQHVCT